MLKAGAHADITLFDADTVIDAADFQDSTRPATGIDTVIVNGVPCGATASRRARGRAGCLRAAD